MDRRSFLEVLSALTAGAFVAPRVLTAEPVESTLPATGTPEIETPPGYINIAGKVHPISNFSVDTSHDIIAHRGGGWGASHYRHRSSVVVNVTVPGHHNFLTNGKTLPVEISLANTDWCYAGEAAVSECHAVFERETIQTRFTLLFEGPVTVVS